MTRIVETYSEDGTFDLAKDLAKYVGVGTIIGLDGDLGAGKTVFAKGFARGLGVIENVTSPTFTLIHEYRSGRIPLFHFDVYRLNEPEEMYAIGFEEYFYDDGVTLVEWASKITKLLPPRAISIRILKDPVKGADYRKIVIGFKNEDLGH